MKTILHLCAEGGSDSKVYADNGYNVIKIGKDIGVENYTPPTNVYGVIANPPCTQFSIANRKNRKPEDGLFLVRECQRIIDQCTPKFWVIENPATGRLRKFLGKPAYTYQPWQFGSPWTKSTALWGKFNAPEKLYKQWEDVPKNDKLYKRKSTEKRPVKDPKPSLAFLHKSAIKHIPEFEPFKDLVHDDAGFRSLCSQNFAREFFKFNQ